MVRFASEDTAEFNMNKAWLIKISCEIDKFIFARHYDNFDMMYTALDTIELLTSPKIDQDDIEKLLDWLRDNRDKWCVRDHETGRVTKINEENKKKLTDKFRECFRLILVKLDEMGILTKLKYDPGKAMGNFSSS